MRRPIVIRWTVMLVMTAICLLSLSVFLGAASAGGPSRAVIWILASELLAPGMIASLALVFFLLHKSQYQWR